MTSTPAQTVAGFVAAFASKDPAALAPFLHEDVVFESYGDQPIHGRDQLLTLWAGVFRSFDRVAFSTLHQATNGDIVIEEQIHGLALPGRDLAPIRNLAVYRVQDGEIIEWRDYTNPQYAQTLL